MAELLEMPDGARLRLTPDGWQSDARPSLANILNTYYPVESDLAAQADRLARRFHWQLLKPLQTALKAVSSDLGINGAGQHDARSAPPASFDHEAF